MASWPTAAWPNTPWSRKIMVYRLPDSIPLEMGALVEPMSVAYHAAVLGEVNDQSRALIYGAGLSASGCGSRCAAWV